MDYNRVIARLKTVQGVKDAVVLDEDTVRKVYAGEKDVTDTSFGMPLDNRAAAECECKNGCVCVFCDYSFELPTDHIMIMEDPDGKKVGFDIPPGKQCEYEGREDLIWISEDFVILGDGDAVKLVMLPQRTSCIGASEGVKDAVMFNPVAPTDELLKKKFGIDTDSPDIASVILAFDWI